MNHYQLQSWLSRIYEGYKPKTHKKAYSTVIFLQQDLPLSPQRTVLEY